MSDRYLLADDFNALVNYIMQTYGSVRAESLIAYIVDLEDLVRSLTITGLNEPQEDIDHIRLVAAFRHVMQPHMAVADVTNRDVTRILEQSPSESKTLLADQRGHESADSYYVGFAEGGSVPPRLHLVKDIDETVPHSRCSFSISLFDLREVVEGTDVQSLNVPLCRRCFR